MPTRVRQLVGDAHRLYQRRGATALKRGATRHARQRLPIELWPTFHHAPVQAADRTVPLFETRSIQVEYTGQYPESLPRELAAAEGRVLGPAGELYVYEDAELYGRRPVMRINDRYFPPSWLGVDTAFFTHQEKFLKRNLPLSHVARNAIGRGSPDRIVDTGFLLLGERGLEFPAWHHEVLPKLRWLEGYENATGESPTLLVPADLPSFHERSLELMGYDPDSWVDTAAGPIAVRRLLVPPHPIRAKGTHLHTTALEWVARRLQSNLPETAAQTEADFADRVFVSRRDADRRHVTNESAVIDALGEAGFQSYEPGRLSYEDEIRLFSGADHIVGVHGKGLASMFHATDATLTELFPVDGVTEHYFLTAVERGFEYEYLTCNPVPTTANVRPRDRDFAVDVSRLRERLPLLATA